MLEQEATEGEIENPLLISNSNVPPTSASPSQAVSIVLGNQPQKEAILLIKNSPENIESDGDALPENVADYVYYNNLFYTATASFKVVDCIVDQIRFVSNPSLENAQKITRDIVHLTAVFEGPIYSMALSAMDISLLIYKGEFKEAVIQAEKTCFYMALPVAINSGAAIITAYTGIPAAYAFLPGTLYGGAMAAYTAYHSVSNAYNLYEELTQQNYDVIDSVLGESQTFTTDL